MKKYLLGLLELRKKELTNRRNELENRYLGATATGLSGFDESVEEIKKEMDKIEACKEKLKELEFNEQ